MYQDLLKEVKRSAPGEVNEWVGKTYLGSPHKFYGVSTPSKRKIVKEFAKKYKNIPPREFFHLINDLFESDSYEGKTIASELIFAYKQYQPLITLQKLDVWLDNLVGWAEVDTLCQSKILIPFLEKNWTATKLFIRALSEDKNKNKRRASLVLLVKPASYLPDQRIFELGIEIVEKLKNEKQVIITKAISWVLRALSNHHKKETKKYIEKNRDSLPKIAIRETLKKIEIGKKT